MGGGGGVLIFQTQGNSFKASGGGLGDNIDVTLDRSVSSGESVSFCLFETGSNNVVSFGV